MERGREEGGEGGGRGASRAIPRPALSSAELSRGGGGGRGRALQPFLPSLPPPSSPSAFLPSLRLLSSAPPPPPPSVAVASHAAALSSQLLLLVFALSSHSLRSPCTAPLAAIVLPLSLQSPLPLFASFLAPAFSPLVCHPHRHPPAHRSPARYRCASLSLPSLDDMGASSSRSGRLHRSSPDDVVANLVNSTPHLLRCLRRSLLS